MSRDPVSDRIEDILDAIEKIAQFTEGMTQESFAVDSKTISAVAYQLGIIGEAVRHLPDDVRRRYPDFPWGKMRAIRNVVIHEYYRVDPLILWSTAQGNLPSLIEPLRRVLEAESDGSDRDAP